MHICISKILPNPFRQIDRYPIQREKVDQLKKSITQTGFWDNIVARSRDDGLVEIAYGHHRLIALREMFSPDHEVELIIRDLDDETMLRIMASENMQEWRHLATVDHETVRAVVKAYAAGKIKLEDPGPLARGVRFAPSFMIQAGGGAGPRRRPTFPYTAITVAAFLDWGGDKVQDVLGALAFIEEGLLRDADFAGLGQSDARAVVEQTRAERRRREAAATAEKRRAEEAAAREIEARHLQQLAEERRQRADKAAREAAEQVAVAKKERERQQAKEAQRRAEQERAEAEEAARHAAEVEEAARRRQADARAKQAAAEKAASKEAAATGREVARAIRQDRITASGASGLVASFKEKSTEQVDLDAFLDWVAKAWSRLFDPLLDERAKKLEEALKYIRHASEPTRINLVKVIDRMIDRLNNVKQAIVSSSKEE